MSLKQEIVFFCWRCGQKLAVPDSVQGRSLSCPSCECSLTVPMEADVIKRSRPIPIVDPLVATENDITFNCEHCSWEIIVDKRAAGKIVSCPGCTEMILVPEPAEMNVASEPAEGLPLAT